MGTLTALTLLQHPHSHPRPPQPPPKCSSSQHLNLTALSLPRPRSPYDVVIPHAVRARNFYFDPRSFSNDDDDNDDGYDGEDFVRRKRSRRRSKQRRWWPDEVEDDEPKGGFIEQAVDNLWILQVFKSYGLFLPVILISLLLATGPKAFLMGSGIPFGLSALVFAFKKLSGWLSGSSPKPKRRRRSKSRFRGKGDVFREEEGDLEEERQQGKRSTRRAYKPGVPADDSTVVNDFGGWDELVGEEETRSSQRPSQTKARLDMMTEKVKLKSTLKEKDVPMFLRLLIAVFPFLGSWTNLL